MPSRFFHTSSHTLRHRTVSLLPDIEKILNTAVAHFIQYLNNESGEEGNFSTLANIIILARVTSLITNLRKGKEIDDPAAIELFIDIVDGKKHVTQQDLDDFSKCLDQFTDAYNKRHPNHT